MVKHARLYEEFGHDRELWSLNQEILCDEVLLTDSTEPSRERPQDPQIQKSWDSRRKGQHTQKTQILGTSDGLEIVDVIARVPGPTGSQSTNLTRHRSSNISNDTTFCDFIH